MPHNTNIDSYSFMNRTMKTPVRPNRILRHVHRTTDPMVPLFNACRVVSEIAVRCYHNLCSSLHLPHSLCHSLQSLIYRWLLRSALRRRQVLRTHSATVSHLCFMSAWCFPSDRSIVCDLSYDCFRIFRSFCT